MRTLLLSALVPAATALGASVVFEESFTGRPGGAAHGAAALDAPGPRAPDYPGFAADNAALEVGKPTGHVAYPDSGEGSPLDFRLGETVTLEAWVRLDAIGNDQNLYVVGKGRTGRPGFLAENQNYALRVRGAQGLACVSFLFRSAANDSNPGEFHRWTSDQGFKPGPAWHHIAASYTFGRPESLRGWIDGQAVGGTWDMGGATSAAPISDDDELWIGSALGGNPGNTFKGGIDEVRIHRGEIDPKDMAARYRAARPTALAKAKTPGEAAQAQGPPVLTGTVRTEPGRVALDVFDGLESTAAWPAKLDEPVLRASSPAMLLHRLPRKYDAWGIRADWQGAALARLAFESSLAPGEYEVVLRGRGGTRLWIGGRVVAETPFLKGTTDGHEPVPALPEPPEPGAQPRGYGDREKAVKISLREPNPRVVLETLVGGPKFRHEPGETLAAIRPAGGQGFRLLAPGAEMPTLRGADWSARLAENEREFHLQDSERRRALAASRDAYWSRRHQAAREWAAGQPSPDFGGEHPVDYFLHLKLEKARAQAAAGAGSSPEAGPAHTLLSDQCFRCHGEKEKGGLRLNTLDLARKGGDSGAALVPGQPEKSLLLERVRLPPNDEERMPPKGDRLTTAQISLLERWIAAGAPYPAAAGGAVPEPAPLLDAGAFARRAALDACGSFALEKLAPDAAREFRSIAGVPSREQRARLVDILLASPRWADHWISYWQDVLAENPNFVKPSLNNSGPFRWFLEEALRDGKPVDRWVTELVMMRGSVHGGGSAGFGMAAENDAPMAHKGTILGSAFLGVEMKCARCHDSPYHATTQKDLFSLAALLERKPVTVPKSSTVPAAFFEKTRGRESLIKVTLPPGKPVPPAWPFEKLADPAACAGLLEDARDSREQLAAVLTAPANTRFPQVMVNRVWKRLMGTGLVEPADDWEGADPSHPELLEWLALDFVAHGYDWKHTQRRIMTSDAYARAAGANPREPAARFFAAPDKRRLSAEQIVDSLVDATGIDLRADALTFDPEALRPAETQNNLGVPGRAWQFASLSNERDRPSLAMPRNQAVLTVLEMFGWRPSRAEPVTCREDSVHVLQPATLANGVLATWLTRLSETHPFTALCLEAESPAALADRLTFSVLGRAPTDAEREVMVAALADGFGKRKLSGEELRPSEPRPPLKRTSWSNHLSEEANRIKLEEEARARAGDPPSPRLRPEWRERAEDVIWALINAPELVWAP